MSIHILVCGALDGLCCCTVLWVEWIRPESFSLKKNLIVLGSIFSHISILGIEFVQVKSISYHKVKISMQLTEG